MKTRFLTALSMVVVIVTLSQSLFALNKGDLNLNTGLGLLGSRGIIGVSGDYFLNENQAISIAMGADFAGTLHTFGYKYFDKAIARTTGTFLDKCLFVFDCTVYPYLGIALQRSPGHEVNYKTDDVSRLYKIDEKYMALGSFGFRDVLPSNFTIDLEISLRGLVNGGRNHLISGVEDKYDQSLLTLGNNGFGFGLAVGYIF